MNLMSFDVQPPDYPMDALEPYISRESLASHVRLHEKYRVELEELSAGRGVDQALGEAELIESGEIAGRAAQIVWARRILHAGRQIQNHNLFWRSMRPPSSVPWPITAELEFQRELLKQAEHVIGSGWLWLVRLSGGELRWTWDENSHRPALMPDYELLACCDLWEHAYYLDYRGARREWLAQFMAVFNWELLRDD